MSVLVVETRPVGLGFLAVPELLDHRADLPKKMVALFLLQNAADQNPSH